MQMRPPAVPLVTVDPYFSVWSEADRLTDKNTVHWTGTDMPICGYLTVDGDRYRFLGAREPGLPALTQTSLEIDAMSTTYTFCGAGVELCVIFTTPVIPSDLYLLSRPVSFIELTLRPTDGELHDCSARIEVSEAFCLNFPGDGEVDVSTLDIGGISSVRMGSREQKTLTRSGDDLRIEWGYLYLSLEDGFVGSFILPASEGKERGETYIWAEGDIDTSLLFSLAYDDIYSIDYFGDKLKAYWKRDGRSITDVIAEAHETYFDVFDRCAALSDRLFVDAVRAGGEKYAEILMLSFRQCIGSHKLVTDTEGELLFISKECYSNGCAATVDVSYPSIPLFLLYNPALVRAMMRPIYKFAASDGWNYDYAPHDAGQYPLLLGQVYGGCRHERQMPVEECGNMLIMEAAAALADGDASFAGEHIDLLGGWVKYLIEYGRDPEDQLCTDDFAGHLAHNCNLTLKAIMGIASYGILLSMLGRNAEGREQIALARSLAPDWASRAANGDGSYRLAFDRPGSWSLKYNLVWDKVFGTSVMPPEVICSETASLRSRIFPYGVPLDDRKPYTKTDWLIWTATMAETRRGFEELVNPLWDALNSTSVRMPLPDLYYVNTGEARMYKTRLIRNGEEVRGDICMSCRTVVGGHFMKLLCEKGVCSAAEWLR